MCSKIINESKYYDITTDKYYNISNKDNIIAQKYLDSINNQPLIYYDQNLNNITNSLNNNSNDNIDDYQEIILPHKKSLKENLLYTNKLISSILNNSYNDNIINYILSSANNTFASIIILLVLLIIFIFILILIKIL